MNKQIFLILLLTTLLSPISKAAQLHSPDGRIKVHVGIQSGRFFYEIKRDGKQIFKPSFLGFQLEDGDLNNDFEIAGIDTTNHKEIWKQVWGEDEYIENHYHELIVHLVQTHEQKRKLDIIFRAFNDGIGFKYIIPQQSSVKNIVIKEENTEFALTHDAPAWSISSNHTAYFEGLYKKRLISQLDTVCVPFTIEYSPDLYMSIHEAALEDYASMNLTPRGTKLITALTPWHNGIKVYGKDSLKSPWRIIIMGDKPGDLITSKLMLNLNEPCKIADTSWIEPGKYIGIWWSIHKKKNTWEQGPHHGATTANVKRYIDFAAQHGFNGVLAEGWNYGWGKGEQINYLKAYPDFDIKYISKYALSKGVRFIAHMESWGNAHLIESQMDSAFAWYHKMGIKVVKTGYVGHLLDNKELAKSQYGIRHYRKVIECAAKHEIMIDNHEPAMPTGISRTYPNLMTQEGVRGQEYNAWDVKGGNPPEHTTIIPFTRGLAGPTDFTPAIFNFSEVVKGTHPHSTIAKQLAEFVVIYSPLQMASDEIESYTYHPGLSFIESCPTTWNKTIVLNGEIGEYITIARKERDSNNWFIGSITNAKTRNFDIKLDFLDKDGHYKATIYEDGCNADFETAPYELGFRVLEVTSDTTLKLKLARSGGAAIRIEKIPF